MLTRSKIVATALMVGMALLAFLWTRCPSDAGKAPVLRDAGATLGFRERPEAPKLAPVVGSGAFSISGHLRGANGEPIAEASITAMAEMDSEGSLLSDGGVGPAIVANTGPDGRFVLQGTGVGSYHLRIEGEMLVTAEVRFVESPGQELELLAARRVSVRGRVLANGKGRPSVQVFLQGETDPAILETQSGAQGEFSFSCAEGAFRIWANAPALASRVQRVERVGAGPFAEIELALEQAYTVRGRVVESGGSELGVSADVTLRSESGLEAEHRVRAMEDGSFAIESVLAGRWIAEAKAPGFVATMAPGVEAESATSIRIALHSGGKISGQVVGPEGQPIEGAQLRLVGKGLDGHEVEYSARHAASALALGPLSGQRLLPMGELGVLLGPIPLVPPRSSTIRIATPLADPASELSGPPPWPDPNRFVSDASGSFLIVGVVPGDYRLVAVHPEYAESSSGPIAVGEAGELPALTLRMFAGTRLFGKIRDQDGLAIAGASVFVRFDDGREQVLTVSDEDGHYEFPPLRGLATVVVEAVGHERATSKRRLENRGRDTGSTELDVRLARADSYIESRIVDATGFAVRNAIVEVEASDKLLPTAAQRSDENGIFRLEGLPPGEHWVKVSHADYPELRQRLATGQVRDLVLPFGGGLSLSVRDRHSQAALAMSTLTLTRLPKGRAQQVLIDEAGLARVLAMVPGRYSLLVEAAGYGAMREEFSIAASERLGETTRDLLIEMSRGATLAGILRDSQGERVAGATLRAGLVEGQSDADGHFRLGNVLPGKLSLEIERAGMRQIQPLSIEAGEERLTMELVFAGQAQSESESPEAGEDEDEAEDEESRDDESAPDED